MLTESQPVGGWLVGREEIEKLGSDPIIMTPDNPSRSHLLEILRETNRVWSETPLSHALLVVAIAHDH